MAKFAGPKIKCIVTGRPGADLHHIKSRAAGGGDQEWNLIAVSHKIHCEIHQKGLVSCSVKYPQIRRFLIRHNYELIKIGSKIRWMRSNTE